MNYQNLDNGFKISDSKIKEKIIIMKFKETPKLMKFFNK